jgi:DNA polymerase-3 subunit delta'
MTAWLSQNRDLSEDRARIFASLSQGSLARAVKMFESDFSSKRIAWLEQLMELHNLSKDEALQLGLQHAQKNKRIGLEESDNHEVGLFDLLRVWQSWFRDLAVVKAGEGADLLINADFSHKMKNIAGNFTMNCLIDSLQVVDQASRDLRRQRNAALVMEYTVLQLRNLQ